jgi:pyruvate/2-oxoglutarate dehydrogenase complex dihydrolipoamide dehydrogenase (E3) component
VIPWATYTSPEIAHVGMSPEQAAAAGIATDTYVQHFEHLDRAILESQGEGFVKIHTRKGSDKMVGATIVAAHAGDMISEIVVAMTHHIGLAKIGSSIHPYPTQSEAIRKLGYQFNKTKLGFINKSLLAGLMRWNVGT